MLIRDFRVSTMYYCYWFSLTDNYDYRLFIFCWQTWIEKKNRCLISLQAHSWHSILYTVMLLKHSMCFPLQHEEVQYYRTTSLWTCHSYTLLATVAWPRFWSTLNLFMSCCAIFSYIILGWCHYNLRWKYCLLF